ncbi:MAG TPA: bifunctional 23S rRNA (guanine(2069)-N(7))-methyltransferase RlmK/23S rRNA (guanine(2445)-N(2))-methyltransferase RlmL [Steroidobacteraceae bacterium]|nr:bifunctional 23S rRNA (guanine(2069)-N(7))-methyltransferase RlmK/23S rRNA (guanine(2445)-N(2))-methyltransferase RlmL [Steroidobacteraceae bacterium]
MPQDLDLLKPADAEHRDEPDAGNVRYWLATAPVGAASVLAEELRQFGAEDIRERSHDVKFQGTLEVGYRACLWSRTATRVLLSLGSIDAGSTKSVYEGVRRIDWREHLGPGATLACDCSGGNESIRHTIYGSQLLKDAVCDALRDATGERPNIRPERPDVLLHLHVEGPTALLSVDFSGESLHRRGYRAEGGRAPLKENVAAAVLLRAGWPEVCERGGLLLDPMCGSGTFLTEGALIAADAAPALDRGYFGFTGWRGHDARLWERLCAEARERRGARAVRRCILGSDVDAEAVRMSIANGEHAGVAGWLHVEKRSLSEIVRPSAAAGLIVTNPPYGERIGAESGLPALYSELGATLRERFRGWQAAVLTGNPPLARNLGIYAKRTHRFFNGTIECRLLRFELDEASEQRAPEAVRADWSNRPGAQMFANRLGKNLKRLESWAEREHIDCYRVYDADMPEYAFAIDLYGRNTAHAHVHVQEYAPPKSVDQEGARERRREAMAVLPQVLGVPPAHVHSRLRKPQKGSEQYEKHEAKAERHAVQEGGLKFWVNFRDYLDTGLFLDHRLVRGLLRGWAKDADFLNLFCYTGSATVYAAAGGARSSASVDLSNTYLDWAHENLLLNGFGDPKHELYRADCLQWLEEQEARGPRFDLIFVDPPTFSNSKRMEGVLDVQRDHVGMIRRSLKLLREGGRLVFSTNYTRFKLDEPALADLDLQDISAQTIPKDFERHARIHRCFVIRRK